MIWAPEMMVKRVGVMRRSRFGRIRMERALFVKKRRTKMVCLYSLIRLGPIYGMLGFIQPSFVQRHVDFADADSVYETYSNPQTLDVDFPLVDSDADKVGKARNASSNSAGLVSSACGHLMQYVFNFSRLALHVSEITLNRWIPGKDSSLRETTLKT
jgi:hypothetical protein